MKCNFKQHMFPLKNNAEKLNLKELFTLRKIDKKCNTISFDENI